MLAGFEELITDVENQKSCIWMSPAGKEMAGWITPITLANLSR